MTTEATRIEQMKADIETIREAYPNEAYRFNKVLTYIVDRDAAPSLELRSENNDLKVQLEAAEAAVAAADAEAAALATKE